MSSHSHNPGGRVAVMLLAVASVLCSLATLAAAQDQPAPKVELYGGYSAFYPGCDLHGLLPGGVVPVSSCLTWNPRGIGASITYNFNRWFGLTVDSSGQWGSGETGLVARIDRSEFFNLSAGPKITFRTHYLSPFLEVLVGGHRQVRSLRERRRIWVHGWRRSRSELEQTLRLALNQSRFRVLESSVWSVAACSRH
jgi:hypothetical protein